MYRVFCCITILAILSTVRVRAAVEGSVSGQDEPTALTSRILAVTDVVLQKHIDPPARQQMILSGVKALYLAGHRKVPQNLSERVSDLGTRSQLVNYLDRLGKEFSELSQREEIMMHGMLSAVPGESSLIEAKANEVNEQVLNNRYVGTGIALTMNQERKLAQITRVFYNGPAWKAGVQPLDLILEIDGESTASKGLAHVVEVLRGESGSQVEVVVRQPNSEESRQLTMTRGRVFIPSVEGFLELSDGQWQYTIDSAPDIALLRVKSIGPSTLHELRQIAAKLRQQNVRGVVFDLREGGGILHDIVMVADSLIDGGTIGHVRSLETSIKHEARSGDLLDGQSITVLVSKHSSAGNVFLVAALQDNERAVVVGEPTGGETYVSSFVSIPGRDDQLKLATAIMLRGDETPLLPTQVSSLPRVEQTEGQPATRPGFIMPDHVVHSASQRSTGRQQETDPILAKAIEVLQSGDGPASSPPNNKVSGE